MLISYNICLLRNDAILKVENKAHETKNKKDQKTNLTYV